MINLTDSPLLVTSSEFLGPLSEVRDELTHLKTLVMVDEVSGSLAGCDLLSFDNVVTDREDDPGQKVVDTDLGSNPTT